MIPSLEYFAGSLCYEVADGRLHHNISTEFALFALWEDAIPFEDSIRTYLGENFTIVADLEILWSERNFLWNACRLYETPVSEIPATRLKQKGHVKKIGKPNFRLFIVRDDQPKYIYHQSVSGKIEPANQNIIQAKALFRSWINAKYRVHSSNNIQEFFQQAALLIGPDLLKKIARGDVLDIQYLEKDLEGADGWSNWEHLFSVLRWSSDYLILRNFETLPETFAGHDIEFLCDDYQRLSSTLGMLQRLKRYAPYKGTIKVSDQMVPTDIRFIGDGHFDQGWQKTVLSQKVTQYGVSSPRADDYFFTLLYHAGVHKSSISAAYKTKLYSMGEMLGIFSKEGHELETSAQVSALLNGYMRGYGYIAEVAIDRGTGANQTVLSTLPKSRIFRTPGRITTVVRKIMKKLKASGV